LWKGVCTALYVGVCEGFSIRFCVMRCQFSACLEFVCVASSAPALFDASLMQLSKFFFLLTTFPFLYFILGDMEGVNSAARPINE